MNGVPWVGYPSVDAFLDALDAYHRKTVHVQRCIPTEDSDG